MSDVTLEEVVLVGSSALWLRLADALALYRNVNILVQDYNEFLDLVSLFGPTNLASFLDEFHESVTVHVFEGSTFYGRGNDVLLEVPEYENMRLAYRRSVLLGGLAHYGDWPGDQVNEIFGNVWTGESALRTLRRFRPVAFPQDFLPGLGRDVDSLSDRFREFLRCSGKDHEGVRVRIGHVDRRGLHNVVIEDPAGRSRLDFEFINFVYSSSDELKPALVSRVGHTVLRDEASTMLISDVHRAMHEDAIRRAGHEEAIREMVTETLVHGVRSLSALPGAFDANLARLAQVRRERLALPNGICAAELVRRLHDVRWYERLPAQTARFALFTGAGLLADAVAAGSVGTAAGVGLGVVESFLLTHFLAGWRPNRFLRYQRKFRRLVR